MRKVRLHNLRVNGNRIDQSTWNQVAEILLPGPAPSASDIRHGKSKSAVLKRIVATDKTMRARAIQTAGEIMSRDAKAEATEAGWLPKAEVGSDAEVIANWRKFYESQGDEYTRCLADQCGCFLADMLHGRRPFPHADLAATVATLKTDPPMPPVMLCGVCGGTATRQLPAGLNTTKLGHYCDRHDWRGDPQPSVKPDAFTFGNNAVEAQEPRSVWGWR
jgi:hypothetical protein